MNNFTFTGNIGKEPEVKFTKSGMCIMNFSVGVARAKKVNGETTYETDWVNCQMFGKSAEAAAQEIHKGMPVIGTGRYIQEKYEDQNGNKKVYYKCVVNDLGILVSRAKSNGFNKMGQEVDEDIPF